MPDSISPFDRPLTHKLFFNIVYFSLISLRSQLQVNCLTLTEEVVGKEVVADELKDLLEEQRERHLQIDQRWSTQKKEVKIF